MAFKLKHGKTKTMYFKRPASQAFTDGDLVYFDGSGDVIPADATSGAHIGVINETVASTDANYADTGVFVGVQVPLERWVIWEVESASAVAADVGLEIDLTDANTADRGASLKDALLVTAVISATLIEVTILSNADVKFTATT